MLNFLLNKFSYLPVAALIADQCHALVHDFSTMYSSFNKENAYADQGFADFKKKQNRDKRPTPQLEEVEGEDAVTPPPHQIE